MVLKMAASNTGPASADATFEGLKARIEPNFKLAGPITTLLESIETSTNEVFVSRYVYNFDESFTRAVITDSIDPGFLIVGKKMTNGKPEYVSVEATGVGARRLTSTSTELILDLIYDPDELLALNFGGPIVDPSFEVTIQQPSDPYYVNTIMPSKINYNSLSSLGSIITEELAVSIDETQSETIGFNTQAQTITDTGGPSVAARETRSFDTESSTGVSTTSTATVTSGRTGY
jgi:hypothetical protein